MGSPSPHGTSERGLGHVDRACEPEARPRPNHFLHRATTSYLRAKQFGDQPQTVFLEPISPSSTRPQHLVKFGEASDLHSPRCGAALPNVPELSEVLCEPPGPRVISVQPPSRTVEPAMLLSSEANRTEQPDELGDPLPPVAQRRSAPEPPGPFAENTPDAGPDRGSWTRDFDERLAVGSPDAEVPWRRPSGKARKEVGAMLRGGSRTRTGSLAGPGVLDFLPQDKRQQPARALQLLMGRVSSKLMGPPRPDRRVLWGSKRSATFVLGEARPPLAKRVVESSAFTVWCVLLVLCHSLFLAVETDFDLEQGPASAVFYVDLLFTLAYMAEMSLRLWVHRTAYFWDRWNWMDMALVSISIADIFITLAATSSDISLNMLLSFRVLRLLRLARLVRLFRLLKPLWLLARGIAASIRTVFWAWLLIGLAIYIYAICFTRIFSRYTCAGVDPELHMYFGDIPRSMFSVFQCITLEEWVMLAEIGRQHEPWVVALFVLLLTSCTWGVMHVLVAVFVESALEASSVRSQNITNKAKKEYEKNCRSLCEVFRSADIDGNGSLSKEEFERALNGGSAISHRLRTVGIDGAAAAALFDILDLDGSKTLDGPEFVEGVLRSVGPAQNKDVIGTRCDVWRVQLSLEEEVDRTCLLAQQRVHRSFEKLSAVRREALPVLRRAKELLAKQAAGRDSSPEIQCLPGQCNGLEERGKVGQQRQQQQQDEQMGDREESPRSQKPASICGEHSRKRLVSALPVARSCEPLEIGRPDSAPSGETLAGAGTFRPWYLASGRRSHAEYRSSDGAEAAAAQ